MIKALCLLLALAITSPIAAAETTFLNADALTPHQKTISRVEQYLSGITTIVADFMQTAPDGSISTGTFYLKRPGLMRWQYEPPTPILMVADAKTLIFYDYQLQQVTHIPLDSTLIGFLAQKNVRFSGTVGLLGVENKHGVIRLTLAQREKPDEGRLMLEFSDNPLQIRNFVVTDATGQTTTISLSHAKYGTKLDPDLFVFKDPRPRRRG